MSALLKSASVARVRSALLAHGLEDRILELAATARTAEDAARACGVPVGAIVKSLVFAVDGAPVLALIAGDRRCDPTALPAALNLAGKAGRCDADTRPRSTQASAASRTCSPRPATRTPSSPPPWRNSKHSPAARWLRGSPPEPVIDIDGPATIEARRVETWPSG
jgi:hypothetical protein